ncbi:MAG: hypothetical protein IKK76_03140 [Alphaproteobacteria bacterium]|nr:hypothetical protein [Alphaproteobacteria bacterium]
MAIKTKHKRRIILSTISFIGALVLAIIIVPPMFTLNGLRPILEKSIYEQTLVPAKFDGDIHFSLIGGATIVAHDVSVPDAKIGAVMLSIPFTSLFNIANAKLNGPVVVYDADITIYELAPAQFNHNIEIYNSTLHFKNNTFKIVRASFTDGIFHGTIRTPEHKYDVTFDGNEFEIKNKNNKLDIYAHIFAPNDIRGHMSVTTDHINEWFGLNELEIATVVNMTLNFEWNGDTGYKFTDIKSDKFSGNISINPNGTKLIQLVSSDIDFDFSFLQRPSTLFYNTDLNIDFYGDLRFGNRTFNHILISTRGTSDTVYLNKIIADNITAHGGTITANGAHDIMVSLPFNGHDATCLYSGTPDKWQCATFTYDNMVGSLNVDGDTFDISVRADAPMPQISDFKRLVSHFGKRGIVRFKFSDIAGTFNITPNDITATYTFAHNRTLQWAQIDMPFLPKFMRDAHGDFTWNNGMLTFTPIDGDWQLSTYGNYFYLTGASFKKWFPTDIDLQSINDDAYTISGFYEGDKISNLTLSIYGHTFSGTLSGNNLTLHTPVLPIDSIMNKSFFDNYAELEFLTNSPILIPFSLPVQISLSADKMIYNGSEYNNFVYVLKPDAQTFSITDTSRGNLLATIEKSNSQYDISIQLNRFVINGELLSSRMPLNIRDTMITAEISLTTFGQIAHDITYNMSGTMDISFDGGYLSGISLDNFYASAPDMTILNAEQILSDALTGGENVIKRMHIIGDYSNGNFITTEPIELSMRHTNAIGGMAITDGMMTAEFDITLRGTATKPATIALGILPDGGRSYSLSEIMHKIDFGFMRAFIRTHDKF